MGEQRWESSHAHPVLGVWLEWGGHCGKAEKPLGPVPLGRGTPGPEEELRKAHFWCEEQGTERRWRPSLPQASDMGEEEEEAVAWGGGASIPAPGLPTAPAYPCSPPSPFASPSGWHLLLRVCKDESCCCFHRGLGS